MSVIKSAKVLTIIIVLMMLSSFRSTGQLTITTSIQELIVTAQTKSSAALLASTRLENQYWRNVAFDAGFKPQFSLNAEIPALNRSISSITLNDGQEAFVNRSFMTNSLGFRVTQNVPQTGGVFSISSQIERLDLFGTSSQNKSTSYLSTPLFIGFNQPLFQFNEIKWNKALVELEYAKAEKQYTEENEMIAIEVVNKYFDLYLTELNLATAKRNQSYLDSLANTAAKRFELGRIGETEMLQVQLGARNADATVSTLEQDKQNKTEILRDYLGIQEEVQFDLTEPLPIDVYLVDEAKALSYAEMNRSVITDFKIRLKSANLDLERAKNSNKPELNLQGSFGLRRSAPTLGGSLSGLQDQESIRIGLNIPIADGGLSRAQREIAQSSLELEELLIKEEKINLQREVVLTVDQISLIRDRLNLAKAALDIADKRQFITKKRYELGKQDATNLNIAIQEHAKAEQSFYNTLWEMWQNHHKLRFLTLYDFANNQALKQQE